MCLWYDFNCDQLRRLAARNDFVLNFGHLIQRHLIICSIFKNKQTATTFAAEGRRLNLHVLPVLRNINFCLALDYEGKLLYWHAHISMFYFYFVLFTQPEQLETIKFYSPIAFYRPSRPVGLTWIVILEHFCLYFVNFGQGFLSSSKLTIAIYIQ